MTGVGTNTFFPASGGRAASFSFYMQRRAYVWNNTGDTAYLRSPDGRFEHWMKVP
jgi:hypothetical protein